MNEAQRTRIGEGCTIAPETRFGDDVIVGNRVTIFPGVELASGTRVLDGAVIGRLTVRTSSVHRQSPEQYQPTLIGPGTVIGCNCVLYTGVRIGDECLLADGASIREGVALERGVFLGRYVTVNYDARIGARTRVMDFTHITGNAIIDEDCFLSIHVSTTNDNDVYLRHIGLQDVDEARELVGPRIGKYVVVGAGAVLNPGIHIGDGSMIASGAVVTKSVPAWSVAMGVPARPLRAIPDEWRRRVAQLASDRGQSLMD